MAEAFRKLKKSLSFRLSFRRTPADPTDFPYDVYDSDSHDAKTSSSALTRLSRSTTTTYRSSRSAKKNCAICLGSMKPGQGHALFTAECSHCFHFTCIASSVKHGNHLCPICRANWKEIPCQAPAQSHSRARVSPLDDVSLVLPSPPAHSLHPRLLPEPMQFADDEPLPSSLPPEEPLLHNQAATINAFPEFPALPGSQSQSEFAVLVSLRAPPPTVHARTPIDLVTVVDISTSMSGTKLELLKHALVFVIQLLSPADRLSIVAFSSNAWRLFHLRRMTAEGRDQAIAAVNSLMSGGGTNIVEGLRKGVRVLEERQQKNPVSSIILLSDGQDNYNIGTFYHRRNSRALLSNASYVSTFLDLLPGSVRQGSSDGTNSASQLHPIPVHTFGFGTDHDAPVMHGVSDASGGTFSFIEAESSIQDAFARCIGGLLSVVVQDLRLALGSASAGVVIHRVPSGNYSGEVSNCGQHAVIDIGDLYAEEAKDFLVHITVPSHPHDIEPDQTTALLTVQCSYKDPLSQETIQLEGETVKIRRPDTLTSEDQRVCLEVDRQRNRLLVAEAIAEAQALAENGELERAQSMLADRQSMILASASAQAGDVLCSQLEAELKEVRRRMASQEVYEETGRAFVLSGLSSHSWQRAVTRGDSAILEPAWSSSGLVGYETPLMADLVTRSQILSSSMM
ncbi:hypothetical protein ACLOJK_021562 [Asimina triloba]